METAGYFPWIFLPSPIHSPPFSAPPPPFPRRLACPCSVSHGLSCLLASGWVWPLAGTDMRWGGGEIGVFILPVPFLPAHGSGKGSIPQWPRLLLGKPLPHLLLSPDSSITSLSVSSGRWVATLSLWCWSLNTLPSPVASPIPAHIFIQLISEKPFECAVCFLPGPCFKQAAQGAALELGRRYCRFHQARGSPPHQTRVLVVMGLGTRESTRVQIWSRGAKDTLASEALGLFVRK